MRKASCLPIMLIGFLLAADVAIAGDVATKTFYRYRNDRGVLVIDDNVPPELAKNGYDLVTINGTVIETVAPALTEEQIAAKEQQRLRAEEAERIREWEISLLRRYRTTAEIEASRDRVLSEFQNQIEILRGNLNSQRAQIEVQQERAADLERRGRPVYESILNNISALQKEMQSTEETIALREKEIAEVRAEFDADIAQFKKMMARDNNKKK